MAASNNIPQAFVNLGLMYENGVFGEINQVRALEYFQKANELGDVNAMHILNEKEKILMANQVVLDLDLLNDDMFKDLHEDQTYSPAFDF